MVLTAPAPVIATPSASTTTPPPALPPSGRNLETPRCAREPGRQHQNWPFCAARPRRTRHREAAPIRRYARCELMKCVTRHLTLGDGNSLPFADPLLERQEPALKRQIQHAARWPPGKRHWALPKAFFLLSGPELGPKTWDLCVAAREGKAQLERVCGISSGPGCCTLLLYCPRAHVRIISLTSGVKGLEPLTPCLQTTGRPSLRVYRRR